MQHEGQPEKDASQARPRLPALFWIFLIVLFLTSMLRESRSTQLEVGQRAYLSWQFVALFPFAVAGLPWILLRLWEETPISLLLGGPLFFLYATSVDWIRGEDRFLPLLIDSAHVLIPILVSVTLFGRRTAAERHRMTVYLVVVLTVVATIYGSVALLAQNVDFGTWVMPRPPGHENMNFVRLSGPLGVSTGLSMILLPAMAFCWQEARVRKNRAIWACMAGLHGLFILWTASRLTPFFLGAMLLFACSVRQIVLLAYMGLAVVFATNLPQTLFPEKWIRLGITDPGRGMALGTTWNAFTSTWQAALVGVGSDRLNILSQTMAEVARGELRFSSWSTEFGDFPYGPHSVLFWSLGSYGILGACLRCVPFIAPSYRTLESTVRSNLQFSKIPLTLFAILISSTGFFFDDTHLTHPYLMCCWFLLWFTALDELKAAGTFSNQNAHRPAIATAATA